MLESWIYHDKFKKESFFEASFLFVRGYSTLNKIVDDKVLEKFISRANFLARNLDS
jgi:hypothetical protein